MERRVGRKRLTIETEEHSGTRNWKKRTRTLLPDFLYPTTGNELKRKNKDQDKQDLLSELLNKYSADGIPPLPIQSALGPVAFLPNQFDVEKNWKDLVKNASSLEVKHQMQQERIWELVETEVGYNKSLHVITDLFMSSLINLQGQQLLTEISIDRLFSNIRDVAIGSALFWKISMCRVLQNSRVSGLPLNPSDMKEGFMQLADFLTPYTRYCAEQMAAYEYSKVCCQRNEQFKTFVLWAEKQKVCDRLKFADLLVKPMQRLTRYSLLLHAILKVTEYEGQREDLKAMISSVDEFVSDVNSSLRHRQYQEQVESVMEKIESYAAVNAPNEECQKYLHESSAGFDLRNPMPGCSYGRRRLLAQSVLQLKDATTRMEVECFLFTDLLLLCKQSKRTGSYKIVKPPMGVDRIVVHNLQDNGSFLVIYKNEYNLPVLAFTLNGDSATVMEWHTKIREAQELYRKFHCSGSSEDIEGVIMDITTFDHETDAKQLSGTKTAERFLGVAMDEAKREDERAQ